MLNCSTACLHCQGICLNGVPVDEDDDEDDVEAHHQDPPTTEDEDAMDEKPLPGPSRPKRMRTSIQIEGLLGMRTMRIIENK
ncbi:hypothetical protein JTB14_003265 [Gonioctena quinquepunctata]|nr:hypothetical protein JTB14_003265 [Gonioctena quinquepunctata]